MYVHRILWFVFVDEEGEWIGISYWENLEIDIARILPFVLEGNSHKVCIQIPLS